MNKIIYAAAAGMMAIALTGCDKVVKIKYSDDYQLVTKEICVSGPITGVVTKCSADIEYVDGPAKITLIAPDDIIDILKVKVNNKKLIITTKDNFSRGMSLINGIQIGFNSDGNIKLVVSYPGVSEFATQGSGDIKVGDIEGKSVSLMSQGSGDISCETINSTTLSILTQGSGNVTVKKATSGEIVATTQGSGDVELKNVFSTTLTALSQGSGEIEIAGESSKAKLTSMGSGDINAKDFKCPGLKIKAVGGGNVITK